MRSRIAPIADGLRSSYWFLPSVMALASVVLSIVTVAIDHRFPTVLEDTGIGSGGVDGARGLLETAAGSLITVAGVSFSIAIVLMSLTSSQFGPRLLRTFMRDRANQVVLGVFVSTYLYCLLVLRTIRGEESGAAFVPSLSVSVSVLLTVASLAVFIYFIHHAAQLIQVSHIIASVGTELEELIDRLVPAGERTSPEEPDALAAPPAGDGRLVRADSSGYVEQVDDESLLTAAVERDVLVRLTVRAGSHVAPGSVLAEVWPVERTDDACAGAIRGAIVLGDQRTEQQDIEFGLQQLEQIALRALSPGINDPFTAGICVDRLGVTLCSLAERPRPSLRTTDDAGRSRVIAQELAFTTLLGSAFDEIRRAGRDIIYILDRLLGTLARIAERAHRRTDLEALRAQAELVLIAAQHGSHPDEELVALEAAQRAALEVIDGRLSETSRREP
ncbi:DUF2254 domain-containing protein [soil metagenome]